MTLFVVGALGVLLLGLLLLRQLQLRPDGAVGRSGDTWDQPSPTDRSEPAPVSVTAHPEQVAGPSIGEIATGVFLGLWMFALSAAGIAVIVTVVVFGSLSAIAD